MAIIIAPTDDFNSFISEATADAYLANRGMTAWDDADEKAPLLIQATDFIIYNYTPVDEYSFIDEDDVVNPLVEAATALLAYYAMTEDLFAVRDSREVIEEESTLEGVGSDRKRYRVGNVDRFPMVSRMLSSIASCSSGSVVVGRMLR